MLDNEDMLVLWSNTILYMLPESSVQELVCYTACENVYSFKRTNEVFWSRRRHIYESIIKMCYNTTHTKGTTSETHIKTRPRWLLNGSNLLSNNCHQICTLVIHTHYLWINKFIEVCYCHWVDTSAGEILISPSTQ
jgi:hypothetical protein